MFENYIIKSSKSYIFLFDKSFCDKLQERLISSVEQRWNRLSDIVGLKVTEWEKPYYLFDNVNESGRVWGRTYNRLIKCCVRNNDINDMPMIHEEAHMISYQKWGRFPYSWSEGFAELIVDLYYNRIEYLTGRKGEIINIEYKKHISEIMYLLTMDDQKYFALARKNHIFYAQSMASLIYYIIAVKGIEQVERLSFMLKENEFTSLHNFIENEVLMQWIEWLDKESRNPNPMEKVISKIS